MKPFIAIVRHPCGKPRVFGGKPKVSVAFEAEDTDAMQAYTRLNGKDFMRVNATAGTEEHESLKPLLRGERVYLYEAGTHKDKPYFGLMEGVTPPGNRFVEASAQSPIPYDYLSGADLDDFR